MFCDIKKYTVDNNFVWRLNLVDVKFWNIVQNKKKIFIIFCKLQGTLHEFMQIYIETDCRCKLEPICIFVLYSVLLVPHFHVVNYSDKV